MMKKEENCKHFFDSSMEDFFIVNVKTPCQLFGNFLKHESLISFYYMTTSASYSFTGVLDYERYTCTKKLAEMYLRTIADENVVRLILLYATQLRGVKKDAEERTKHIRLFNTPSQLAKKFVGGMYMADEYIHGDLAAKLLSIMPRRIAQKLNNV